MTVAELIEELQRLPGDAALRTVEFRVTVHRYYAAPTQASGEVYDVDISGVIARIHGSVFIE